VPYQFADGLDVHALGNQNSDGAVPEVMDSHPRQASHREYVLKSPEHIPFIERSSGFRGKDQVSLVAPFGPGPQAFLLL
jgi:hypothetical protein